MTISLTDSLAIVWNNYTCRCEHSVVDIDECREDPSLCTPGGTCHNTADGYRCVCKRGFKLDSTGRKCVGRPDTSRGNWGGGLKCPKIYIQYMQLSFKFSLFTF